MKLEIRDIKEKGTDEERLVLAATEDCDIGKYFAFLTKKNAQNIVFTNIKNPYWFPDKLVKKGDLVILYSKKGTDSSKENKDGSSSHFYYRNLVSPIFIENYFALIVEANTWQVEK